MGLALQNRILSLNSGMNASPTPTGSSALVPFKGALPI